MSRSQPLTMADSPLGAATLLRSVFDAGEADQYKRELVANSIEAGATEIIVTGFRMPNDTSGGVKAAFVDNGRGIGENKIIDYLGTLFSGASEFRDGNFQMGARVSTLPWNPYGVIVASWTEDDPVGAMIWITYNEDKGYYELQLFGDDENPVGEPYPEYKHEIIERDGHGTVFLLLGGSAEDHTIGDFGRPPDGKFAYAERRNRRTDWHYYNGKFWSLPDGVKLRFMWGAPEEIENLMTTMPPGTFFDSSDAKSKFRTHKGLDQIIRDSAESYGTVAVVSRQGYRAEVHWALFPEEKIVRRTSAGGGSTDTEDYGVGLGFFGELHRATSKKYAEVYDMHYPRRRTAQFRLENYGISRRDLRDRVAIVVEPEAQETADYIGVQSSPSRDALRVGGKPLPHEEWGELFAQTLPQAIRDRMKALDGEGDGELSSRLKRLQKKIKEAFVRKTNRAHGADTAPVGTPIADSAGLSGASAEGDSAPTYEPHSRNAPHESDERDRSAAGDPAKPKKPTYAAGSKGNRDAAAADATTALLDITPHWDYTGEEFASDETAGLLARWIPANRVVYVNGVHPYLQELIRAEKTSRKRSKSEEVEKIVQNAIMTHLVSHIASTEAFMRSAMASGHGRTTRYKNDAVSDAALSATLTNIGSMELVIQSGFAGRAGLGRLSDRAD